MPGKTRAHTVAPRDLDGSQEASAHAGAEASLGIFSISKCAHRASISHMHKAAAHVAIRDLGPPYAQVGDAAPTRSPADFFVYGDFSEMVRAAEFL